MTAPTAPTDNAVLEEVRQELRQLRAEVHELRKEGRTSGGPLLSTAEAAAHLRLSPGALLKRVERGQVQASRLGRRLRFRRKDLDALLGE